MGVKRKQHSAEFKAPVAIATLSGEKTLAELSAEFGVHPNMTRNWKQELMKRAGELFARGSKARSPKDAQKVIDDLHRKIGRLQVEYDFLAGQPAIFYRVAIIDWVTRRALSWRLSNTLTAGFCVAALSEALARFGKPDIFNTDQSLPSRKRGARNSPARSSPRCCAIMGSRSAWTDVGAATTTSLSSACGGIVKHEWVYLRPAADGIEQKRSLGEFFDWYNLRRPHQALGWRTPDEAYLGQSTAATALAA